MPATTAIDVGAVYVDHHAELVRWLARVARDPDDAADLAQEAFARLTATVESGHEPEVPVAWLRTVGLRLAITAARHRAVVNRHARLDEPSPLATPEGIVVDRETWHSVSEAVDKLRPHERRAVLLAAEGHDGAEIAREIGRSVAATRTILCRTRAALRSSLTTSRLAAAEIEPLRSPAAHLR